MGRSPTLASGGQPPVRAEPVDWMRGVWVTSFSSFVHDEPLDDKHNIPRIAAYSFVNGHEAKSGGYFFAASLLCLKFDGQGSFTGRAQIMRGARPAPQDVVYGTYRLDPNPALGVIEGAIFAVYPDVDGDPNFDIHTTYAFVVRNLDEIVWLRTASDSHGIDPFRHHVAQGKLERIAVHP